MGLQCDVANETSVKAMVEATVKRFGGVDILINNAAYFMTVKKGPFWEMAVEEFDKAMAINVRGVWLCAKSVFPYMKERSKGKIINISSGVALNGNPNYIHYVSSKGAVISMTRAMAREVGQYGSRFSLLCQQCGPRLYSYRRAPGGPRVRAEAQSAALLSAKSS